MRTVGVGRLFFLSRCSLAALAAASAVRFLVSMRWTRVATPIRRIQPIRIRCPSQACRNRSWTFCLDRATRRANRARRRKSSRSSCPLPPPQPLHPRPALCIISPHRALERAALPPDRRHPPAGAANRAGPDPLQRLPPGLTRPSRSACWPCWTAARTRKRKRP